VRRKDYLANYHVKPCLCCCLRIGPCSVCRFFKRPNDKCEGGKSLPDSVTIDCDFVPAKSAYGITVIVVASLGIAFCGGLIIWVIIYRESKMIRRAQPSYLLAFLIGETPQLCKSSSTTVGCTRCTGFQRKRLSHGRHEQQALVSRTCMGIQLDKHSHVCAAVYEDVPNP
jgi:hypothetical protein